MQSIAEEILDASKHAIEHQLALDGETIFVTKFITEKEIFMTRNNVSLGKVKALLIRLLVLATLVLNFLVTPIALADDSGNLCLSQASDKRAEALQLRQQAIDARGQGDDQQGESLDEQAAKADEEAATLESEAGQCPLTDSDGGN